MKRSVCIIFAAAAVLSCAKQGPAVVNSPAGNQILFNVCDDVQVKSSVESVSDLTSGAHVYLWATKDNANLLKTEDSDTTHSYCNKELFYNSTNGLWDITGNKMSWECKETTHESCIYNFSAYAYKGNDIKEFSTKTAAGFGKSFRIELPASYSFGCGTDYLLSNVTSVVTTWNGSAARGGLVNLHMEHALASIRVVVKANADIYRIGIQGIQIKDFYRGATMQCTSQEAYGSGKMNKWTMSQPTYNTTNYIVGDVTKGSGNTKATISSCPMIINKSDARERTIMEFIAVPQDPAYAVLTIAYLVQEINGASEHQVVSTWNLSDYPKWEYGYRNRYTITIDTSNSLYSTIDDWETGNSVTGVVLP